MLRAWPEAKRNLHVDAWREVTTVDGHHIAIAERDNRNHTKEDQLFFINLGGYQKGVFDELHFKILAVQKSKALAVKQAKQTIFYKEAGFKGANSHIDDHHGLDVDDIYKVNDLLPAAQKDKYRLIISKGTGLPEDELHLGYFKLGGL
jgi:hypothetical protein